MEGGRWRRACPAAGAAVSTDSGRASVSGAVSRALCRRCPLTPRTLASRIARRENADFVGRTRELLVADTLFGPDAPASVLLVHGRGGIGKSVLLREIRRRGEQAGWTPFAIDARDLTPVPDAVENALAGAWAAERPLVLIDTYERMSALGGYLRATLLPSLPARAVVVVAEPRGARARLVRGRLGDRRARAPARPAVRRASRARCSTRQGLDDDRRASGDRALGGRPAAGAAAGRGRRARRHRVGAGRDAAALRAHLRRVAEAALDGPFADVFALACVARVVTPALLADVLPELDAPAALRWLAGCAFADARPGGVTLHELVRRPLRAELREREPERERELRARVADSLHARALAGELALTIDLADLVEDPAVRAGYSWDGGIDHHVTGPAPGDEQLAPRRGHARVLRATSPSTCSSRATPPATPCGYAIAFAAGTDSPLALADPRLGRWLAHAPADDDRLARLGRPHARPALARAGAAEHGGDPALGPAQPALRVPADRSGLARRARVQRRGRRRPRARARRRRRRVPRARLRPGRAARRAARPRPPRARRSRPRRSIPTRSATRCATCGSRTRSRAARWPGPRRRAVRALLEDAAERAFGDTPDERLLQQRAGPRLLRPGAQPRAAARELHLSRAAYFRRLRAASERVAAWLAMGSSSTA